MDQSNLVRIFLAVLALSLLSASVSLADGPECPVPLVERQRYGFVATGADWVDSYDYAYLNSGWVVDHARPAPDILPEGLDRALLINTYAGYSVDSTSLGTLVDDNPGDLWLVGNEPDCIWQDNVLPEEYARIYHEVYTFIKNHDQSSRVSPGGIVQPTPLRLEWLDRVLAAYQAEYGRQMPLDAWNIHNAILNEQRGGWGAEIPPGIDATQGVLRDTDDNDSITIFVAQLWAFRQWMADQGYAGYPLIVTEHGVLLPEILGFTESRVKIFMDSAFDFMLNTTDPVLGDPNDGHRLVQRWAWYSLADKFNPITYDGFNGYLFDPDTKVVSAFGQNYSGHTASLPPLSYVDLAFSAWKVLPATGSPPSISRQVQVRITNLGTANSGGFTVALDYSGPVSGALQETVTDLAPISAQWLTFTLGGLPAGGYQVSVRIDADGEVVESRECNNQATRVVIAPVASVHLPLVFRQGGLVAGQAGPTSSQVMSRAVTAAQTRDVTPGFHEFEVPTAASYPARIELDAQGRLWITERDANKIARFDPQTETWTEWDIPTANSQPWGLAVDGAGEIWFAEMAGNKIGRFDPDPGTGGFTEYPIPSAGCPLGGCQPWGVDVGPDGTIWFSESAGNTVGKLAPSSGLITEYPIPVPGSEPAGIDAGSRYVWFALPAADGVARLEIASGTILDFYPPTPGSAPQDVVLTDQAKPWFTERSGNNLLFIDPETAGLFHEIGVHTTNSEPFAIALERDVAVWFTQWAGNRLGRFSGQLPPVEYALPTAGSQPTGIVVDGDDCVWYTAPGANRIGRLCLPIPYAYASYLPVVIKD